MVLFPARSRNISFTDELYKTFTSTWDKLPFTQRKNVDSTEYVNERGNKVICDHEKIARMSETSTA
jgi:hypothetical protein